MNIGGVHLVLAPIDIHNKEFTRGFRGYNEDEVNEFLDQVMKDYEINIRKKKELEKQVEELQERVDNYISIEESLNKSIVVDQETANEKKEKEKQDEELQERVDNYISIEESLNKSIVVAQETAEEVKAGARKEAKLIIKEAEKNADRIVDEAFSQSQKISVEMDEMKRQTRVYRSRLKTIIEAQLDMVNNEEWGDLIEKEQQTQESVENASESSN